MKNYFYPCLTILSLLIFTISSSAQINDFTSAAAYRAAQQIVPKTSNELWQVFQAAEKHALTNHDNISSFSNEYLRVYNGYVEVDLVAEQTAKQLLNEIAALDFTAIAAHANRLIGNLRADHIPRLQTLTELKVARLSYQPLLHSGIVHSQGDTAQISDRVRSSFSYNGTGIKIGILSDSYDILGGAQAGIAAGELPGAANPFGFTTPVTVVQEYNGGNPRIDEGRAMAEIIHDIAPGAELFFYSGFIGSEAGFVTGIEQLLLAGCQIIVDDVGFFEQSPWFQDGIVAQAVDNAVMGGCIYITAAGNWGRDSYASAFNEYTTMSGGTRHDFDPSMSIDVNQQITVPADGSFTLVLQWEDPFGTLPGSLANPVSDLGIFLYGPTTSGPLDIIASADNFNIDITFEPREILRFTNDGIRQNYEVQVPLPGTTTFNLVIHHFLGPVPNYFKYILLGSDGVAIDEHHTHSSTIVGHQNAGQAISVGAAPYYNTMPYGAPNTTISSYSSAGNTPTFFDIYGNPVTAVSRQKPEITGPDHVNTSFFGTDIPQDTDSFPNFIGTSAAAPHVAAATALLLNAGATSRQDVFDAFTASAEDMDDPHTAGPDPGFDFGTGYGFIRVKDAIDHFLSSLPVELVDFDVRLVNGNSAMLKWETASELNSDRFIIKQALANGRFERIASIDGAGFSQTSTHYQHRVFNLADGWNYFQLWQQDMDGSLENLSTGAVYVNNEIHQHFTYQQGGDQVFSFQSGTAGDYLLSIYAADGRRIRSISQPAGNGQVMEVRCSTVNWAKGLYFYTIANEGSVFQPGRFVVE